MSKTLPSIPVELLPTLLEVIDVCPVDRCNPADCPLHAVRKLTRRQRLLWFNSLTKTDLHYLAAYHKVCMGLKLAARPPAEPESQAHSTGAHRKSKHPKAPEAS